MRLSAAGLLESVPVFSMRPQAIQVEVRLRNLALAPLETVRGLDWIQAARTAPSRVLQSPLTPLAPLVRRVSLACRPEEPIS